jgi:MFS family permease
MAPQETTTAQDLQEPLLGDSHDDDLAEPTTITTTTTTNDDDDHKNITLPAWCCCCFGYENRLQVNHNVFLNLVVAVLYGISESLWNGTAFAAYLKKIGRDRNGPLGDIEAVSGLTTLFTALPVGYLADSIGRSKVIAAGGILLGVTSIVQIGVLRWVGTDEEVAQENTTALWIMGVLMAFWGLGDGVVNGPCSALYADSTPEGERSTYYNYLFAAYTSSTMVGPLVSIGLFQTLGDEWDLYDLRFVIYVGLGLEVFISILMCFFDDDKALEENGDDEDGDEDELDDDENDDNPEGEPETEPLIEDEPQQSTNITALTPLQRRQRWIPYIIFGQGLIFALGSGMTVKFFPLFFKDEVGMSPSQVQIVYCLVPLVMVICSTLASKIAATGFGRVQTTLVYSILGVACLYFMVFFKVYLDSHPFLLVPIYVLRTSLMNATYPLQESILMDFVPKEVRARWKSLDAVAAFGWCGSAALGGWLSDKFDYTYTFLITAILQSVGIGVWTLLLPLVPRTEGSSHDNVVVGQQQQQQQHEETRPPQEVEGLENSD